jgi:arginine/ornithine transport system permease protein
MFDLHGYGPSILQGTMVTLNVAAASLCIAMFLGIVGALSKLSPSRILRWSAQAYTTVIRGIPDLVLMLLIYFGGQVLINRLAPHGGLRGVHRHQPLYRRRVYHRFHFRRLHDRNLPGAILAVPAGQLEAGHAYGMSRLQVFYRILLPQMVRHAIPGFGNNWLVLVKTTALVSIIGLDDMVRKAGLAAGATRLPFTYYFVVALLFLAITTISVTMLGWLENRYSMGERRM